jgi:membrane glycosyltransferase
VRALMGRSVGWDAQPRGDRGVSWSEAFKRHRWHVAIGAVWGAIILAIAPRFIWWMLPVVVGMLISAPFTTLTSRSQIGLALRRRGLLLVPEEFSPPPELAAAAAARDRNEHRDPPQIEHRPSTAPVMVPARAPLTMLATTPAYMLPLRLPRDEVEETTAS